MRHRGRSKRACALRLVALGDARRVPGARTRSGARASFAGTGSSQQTSRPMGGLPHGAFRGRVNGATTEKCHEKGVRNWDARCGMGRRGTGRARGRNRSRVPEPDVSCWHGGGSANALGITLLPQEGKAGVDVNGAVRTLACARRRVIKENKIFARVCSWRSIVYKQLKRKGNNIGNRYALLDM